MAQILKFRFDAHSTSRWMGRGTRYAYLPLVRPLLRLRQRQCAGKEVRKHIGVQLGEKAKLRKWEAEKKLREIIAAASKRQPKPTEQTLAWFARERFLPMREPQWAPSTRETNLYNLNKPHLASSRKCSLGGTR